jgi:hypothetical protein
MLSRDPGVDAGENNGKASVAHGQNSPRRARGGRGEANRPTAARTAQVNPLQQQSPPLLNEHGVLIANTHLTVPGQTSEFRNLTAVRITTLSNIFTSLFGRSPTFRLMVSTDPAFVNRIQAALNRVAARAGGPYNR